MQTRVGTVTVRKVPLDIMVTNDGYFSLTLDDGEGGHTTIGTGDTLEKAKAAASNELRKADVQVEVPFKTLDDGPGIAYQIHKGNGKVLVRYAGDRKDAVSGGSYKAIFKPDTPDDAIEEMKRLEEVEHTARRARNELLNKWHLDLGREVRAAIEVVAKAAA